MSTALEPTDKDFEQMMQMLTAFPVMQIAGAVASYSIADHLAKGPATAEQISAIAGIDPSAADNQRLGFRMIDVGENDRPAPSDFNSHKVRCDIVRNSFRAPAIGRAVAGLPLVAQVLSNGDVFHLASDDLLARVPELGAILRPGIELLVASTRMRCSRSLAWPTGGLIRLDLFKDDHCPKNHKLFSKISAQTVRALVD